LFRQFAYLFYDIAKCYSAKDNLHIGHIFLPKSTTLEGRSDLGNICLNNNALNIFVQNFFTRSISSLVSERGQWAFGLAAFSAKVTPGVKVQKVH